MVPAAKQQEGAEVALVSGSSLTAGWIAPLRCFGDLALEESYCKLASVERVMATGGAAGARLMGCA